MELRVDESPSVEKGPGVICKGPSLSIGNPPPHPQGRRRLQCTVENCGYSTFFSKDLGRHMRKHTGERPFTCPHCPHKTFSRHDKLSLHLRTHTGLHSHPCPHCPHSAPDAHSLRRHARTHSNNRPHQCQLCPYAAKEAGQLNVHLRTHTDHCPFPCPEPSCDANFKTPSDLKRHSRVHNGEKPYPCPLCSYRASVKCNLNSHLRKIHGEGRRRKGEEWAGRRGKGEEEGGGGDSAPHNQPQEQQEEELPFQYACKKCPFKAETLPLFNLHMNETHCEEPTFLNLPLNSPKKRGRPRKRKEEAPALPLASSHSQLQEEGPSLPPPPSSSGTTEWEFIVFNTE